MKKQIVYFLLLLPCLALGQEDLATLRSRYSDSFVEWELFCYLPEDTTQLVDTTLLADPEEFEEEEIQEEYCGKINLRWLQQEDWTQWDYQLGDESGTIRQKWRDDPTQWEVRSYDGDILTMRQLWPNDPTQWTVTDNEHRFTFKSRWTSQADEWIMEDSKCGKFYFYTLREGDPRDWAIEDSTTDEVSDAVRIAFIFIATYISAPKQ